MKYYIAFLMWSTEQGIWKEKTVIFNYSPIDFYISLDNQPEHFTVNYIQKISKKDYQKLSDRFYTWSFRETNID